MCLESEHRTARRGNGGGHRGPARKAARSRTAIWEGLDPRFHHGLVWLASLILPRSLLSFLTDMTQEFLTNMIQLLGPVRAISLLFPISSQQSLPGRRSRAHW